MEPLELQNLVTDTSLSADKVRDDVKDYRLISRANDEFEAGNYDSCLENLEQLESLNASNSKLLHNRAVAHFYKTNCTNYKQLLKSLEELDSTEVENSALPAVAPLNYSTFNISSSTPISTYNKALIYYHRQMYQTAIVTLSPAAATLESCNERVATLIGVLMLRLLLSTNQLKKAYKFLEVLLKRLNLTLAVLCTEDAGAEEILPSLEPDLGKSLRLLAMLTLVHNRKAVLIAEDGSAEYAALKAYQYYIMKDFQMAAKQLKKINRESGQNDNSSHNHEINTLVANNMGVIHLRVRHYAIAAKFFQNAITFDKHIAGNLSHAKLHEMSTAKSCEILYNLGISMLHLRRPKEAFQCFLLPLKTYHSNPRLWLRMAESCIMEYEVKRATDEKNHFNSTNAKRQTLSNRVPYSENSQSSAVPEPTMPFAILSLRNALKLTRFYSKYLSVSSATLEESSCNDVDELNWHQIKDNNYCNPSGPVAKSAVDHILSSIYAAYSYVSLRLGDYVTALEMAQELLKVEKISDAHKMLAHMYAGESLIMMDKLAEARPYLEPTFVSTLNTFDFETKDWQVKSLDAAQSVVRYNLAIALTLQNDYDMAKNVLMTCTHPIIAGKVYKLKVYIEKAQSSILSNIPSTKNIPRP